MPAIRHNIGKLSNMITRTARMASSMYTTLANSDALHTIMVGDWDHVPENPNAFIVGIHKMGDKTHRVMREQ